MKTNLVPLIVLAVLVLTSSVLHAALTTIIGPSGSGAFGTTVTVLPNGNFVVTDPSFDKSGPTVTDVGAVYLYGPTGTLISTLTGSTANDLVGNGGIVVLSNGNFLVRSSSWNNGAASSAGAVTWGSATTGFGVTAEVSSSNSIVGGSANDLIGNAGLFALTNGNYVVCSSSWDNNAPAASNAGAATWGNGSTGTSGVVSSANSLVGASTSDRVGIAGVTLVGNGNYVVRSTFWSNTAPSAPLAGAVTWGDGTMGISGVVSSSNSLVGTHSSDQVGSHSLVVLTNGHYVVVSAFWDNLSPVAPDAGAITWCNGTTGTVGAVTDVNSLVGVSFEDQLGSDGVIALTNGNYIACSSKWDNTISAVDAGAATWGNGGGGTVGAISSANSLVGSASSHKVGSGRAVALTNGNYVVMSPGWDNGATIDVGAVTWSSGNTGITGAVTTSNSLVGTTAGDAVGEYDTVPLTNGNYVVRSPSWDRVGPSVANVGAVTWGNGSTGITGAVTTSNSLVGSSVNDSVGEWKVTALTNGNYVISSPGWDKPSPGAVANAGAATWGSGTAGITGSITVANSLIGSTADDAVSSNDVKALPNGNYVVTSPDWDNPSPATANVGAVTWCNGTTGRAGSVSIVNSLIGSTAEDKVGGNGVTSLTNGNYVVGSAGWDNGAANRAGAVTWSSGLAGVTGAVSATNSLVGIATDDLVGNGNIIPLSDGNFAVVSINWNNFPTGSNGGAVTLGDGASGLKGPVHSGNSEIGASVGNGSNISHGYQPALDQLVVGRRNSNRVTLFTVSPEIVVEQPSGFNRIDNVSTISLGSVPVGSSSAAFVFTVKSISSVALNLTSVSVTGGHSGDFTVNTTGMSSSITPDGSTTFSVTFTPTTTGGRSTTLRIDNDDTSENPFTITLTGTGTLSPGALALNGTGFTVEEDDVNAMIPIIRTGGTAGEVRVKVATTNGTAASPADFTALAPAYEVIFPDGVTTANAVIPVINSATTEVNETFTITLSAPTSGAILGAQTTAPVTIIDLSSLAMGTDATAPGTPVITTPAADARIGLNTGANFTVTGNAADNKGVKQVEVSHNGGGFVNAVLAKPGAPSTGFTHLITPTTGLNTLQVKTTDYATRTSSTVTRNFVVTRLLAVTANATHGSVTTGFSPSSYREVGKLVSLMATPKPGYLFWRWLVNALPDNGTAIGVPNSDIDNPTISFIFKEGTTLEAQFVLAFYAGEANNGSYAGAVEASPTLPDRAPLGTGVGDGTLPDLATEGLFTANVTKTGSFTGKLSIDGLVLPVAGTFDAVGEARFGTSRSRVLSVARIGKPSLAVALQLYNNSRIITGTIAHFGPTEVLTISTVNAPQSHYSIATNLLDTYYLTVAGTAKTPGNFNARFASLGLGAQPAGFTAADYPQGDGIGFFKLTNTGAVTMTGNLADGTAISASTTLSQANTFRLFVSLYNKRGFIAGNVTFNKVPLTTDLTASNVLWFRPIQDTQHYPRGWQHVKVDLLGAKYSAVTGTSVLTGLTSSDTSDINFSAGKLIGPLADNINVSNADIVTNLATGTMLVITRTTGKFSGVFIHSDGTKPAYQGIILQKGSARGGYGFFQTTAPKVKDYTGQSGGVLVVP